MTRLKRGIAITRIGHALPYELVGRDHRIIPRIYTAEGRRTISTGPKGTSMRLLVAQLDAAGNRPSSFCRVAYSVSNQIRRQFQMNTHT